MEKGYVVTNETYMDSCSVYGKAKMLARVVLYDEPLRKRLLACAEGGESEVIAECVKWLQEEHKENWL